MKLRIAFVVPAVFAAAVLVGTWAQGRQPTSDSPLAPPQNGPRRVEPASGLVVFTNATVHVKPGTVVERATLVIRDGKIVSVEPAGIVPPPPAPPGAQVRDATGLHIYAGFIEPYFEVDVPRPDLDAPGSHWSPRITPQRTALDRGGAGIDRGASEQLRALGFTAAAIAPKGGIFRGTSAVVSLAERSPDPASTLPRIYKDRAYQSVAFELARDGDGIVAGRGDDPRWSRYPNSQTGAIALIRQTLSDAAWQQKGRAEGYASGPRNALDGLFRPQVSAAPGATEPAADAVRVTLDPEFLLFNVEDELEVLRAATILTEFNRSGAAIGNGQEYRRLEAIKQTKMPLIVPLFEVKPPQVATIGEQESVSLNELIAWEQAPLNAKRLDDAGITVALTSAKVPDRAGGRGAFEDRLNNALKHGLSPDRALAMLTTNAAAILGVGDTLGTVEKDKAANLVIADGLLFTAKPDAPRAGEPGFVRAGRIIEVYCDGERSIVKPRQRNDLGGVWNVTLEPGPKAGGNVRITFEIEDNGGGTWPPEITILKRTTEEGGKEQTARVRVKEVRFEQDPSGDAPSRFGFTFEHEPFGEPGVFTNIGTVGRGEDGGLVMRADATRSDGARFRWTAVRTGDLPREKKKLDWTATWTIVGPNGPFKVDDPNEPRLVIERDTKAPPPTKSDEPPAMRVQVYKGKSELPTSVVRFEREGEAAALVYTVKGLDNATPDAEKTITLRPVKDNPDRLSGALGNNAQEGFQLARVKDTPENDALAQIPGLAQLGLPIGPFARIIDANEPRDTVISNATIWTCTDKGVIKDASLVIRDGKIAFIGTSDELGAWFQKGVLIQQPWREVDAKGKHITPGIIDAHSHTGISKGINESGQAVTAEVRMGDVTDPDSISWYRQLAGGVTAVNTLHGSANPIGGQSQTNKNRWGCIAPNDMHFEGAMPGIKFALGENVKQSNWGDQFNTRYPQTRMGVETLMRDRFAAAKEYAEATKPRSHGATKGEEHAHGRDTDIPGSDRLAEGNGADEGGLSRHISDAREREVRADQPDAQGGGIGPFKHRGGARTTVDEGLRSLPAHRAGISGGTGNADGTGVGVELRPVRFTDDGTSRGNGSGASRANSFTEEVRVANPVASALPSPSWLRGSVAPSLPPRRRDLELEALAEIIAGTRLIHCHSYRQDEILALCRVGDEFGFKLGTFQHGLECYKVAESVKTHAIGASLFSDWWAYKAEVQDAIPQAGPILAEQGVVVSYNSDSDELARRMNVEAGKAVKYSHIDGRPSVPPEEALKFVTLNPAKQLKIDNRVGSLEVGKDADIAIWSGPPMSPLSRCERTFVDGRQLFSLEQDAAMRVRNQTERARIIQKLLGAKARAPKPDASDAEKPSANPSGTPGEELDVSIAIGEARRAGRRLMLVEMEQRAADQRREHYLQLLQRGLDPRFHRSGDCGCGEWYAGN